MAYHHPQSSNLIMATTRQKRVARKIPKVLASSEVITGAQIVASVGYGPDMQRKPGEILNSPGVQSELTKMGFTEEKAKEVVSVILGDDKQAAKDRLKAAEMVFKVHGSFKESERPSERGPVNYTFIFNPAVQAEVKELEAKIKAQLIGANPNVGPT